MPRLSIIIVTYNSRADIEACLQSLMDAGIITDGEILVVDNASTDGTVQYLRDRWPGVRLLESAGNVGFAKANNVGIRQTFGELVLLLNPDTIVPPGAIDALVAVLDQQGDVGVVGPRIVDAEGRAELSFGAMISPLAELKQRVLVKGSDAGFPFLRWLVDRMTRRSRDVDWVSGACLLAWRRDLDAVGLLDERFFLYTEDVDLCASLRARGRRIRFVAEAEIVHRRGRSAATVATATARAYRDSQIAFYQKHRPRWVAVLRSYLRLFGKLPDSRRRHGDTK